MRSSFARYIANVTVVTSKAICESLELGNLRQGRLEGRSSRYWTPSEKRSQGLVSSGSSTLLPSAVLRPTERHGSPKPARLIALTHEANGSRIWIVSQTACQLLASSDVLKGSGLTARSLSAFWPSTHSRSNLRPTLLIPSRRKLNLSALDSL